MSLQKFPSFFLNYSEGDMAGENGNSYRFGRFTLTPSEHRLTDADNSVPLTPKAFEVLSVLVEHAGHLVEKDELMNRVWPDSFVEEVNLAKIIHTLRKTLGDDGNGSKLIETVPKKGYRFVGEIEEILPLADDREKEVSATGDRGDAASLVAEPATFDGQMGSTGYRRYFVILGSGVFLLLLVTGFWVSNGSLMPRALSRLVRHSQNSEAYREFQKGKSLVEQGHPLRLKNEALEHFEKAIEIDPDYAEAYAGKADVMSVRRDAPTANDDVSTARAAAKKAIALDPDNAYGHMVYCRIIGTNDWDFEGAVTECQLAVELDPNDARARRELGLALGVDGRQDEALEQLETAVALSPTSANKSSLGFLLYLSRQYDDAIAEFQQMESTDPDFIDWPWLMSCFAMKNDEAKAFEYLVKTQERYDIDPQDLNAVKAAFVSGGWPAAVRATYDVQTGIGRKPMNHVVDLLAQIGEKDKAFEVLDRMRNNRRFGMVNIARDPMLDPIRDDPRYLALISEMKLK